ncbi:hypothetical protein ACWGPQ_12940 [Saccharomonospora azurea]|uniref:Uncharacterized protein n=2 Tax=Saccharomonospora azurea TaxID=40988 RepID=H8GCI1_9PSEU|nr:hypothetical protein [Saccharomonospora azurea]EHY89789.1 hypothetical protein SacazDRAFT_02902 [Saccharomonospora azurea NA-128]
MTDDNQKDDRRGSMRFQNPETTTPREPTLAEKRARLKAVEEQRRRAEEEQQARQAAEEKARSRRKLLGAGGVTVGLVGVVAAWYLVAVPDEVTAVCTTADGTIVDDDYCDDDYVSSHHGYHSGGWVFIPMPGGGTQQYRYNYGGTGTVGQPVSGGTYTRPSNASITTKSGTTVQRGGFGISGGSFGKGGGS